MKKIIFCILALSSVLMVNAKSKESITLSFTVQDKKLDNVEVMLAEIDTIVSISTEGKAEITLPMKEAMYGMVKYKFRRSVVYLEPGVDLHVTYDMAPTGLTASFEGKNANKNEFINSKKVELPKNGDFPKPEDEVLDLLDEYLHAGYKALDAENFDKEFTEKDRIRIDYAIYGFLWQYATKKECSSEIYDELRKHLRYDEWLPQLSVYLNYMDGAAGVIANEGKGLDFRSTPEYAINKARFAKENYTNPQTRDYTIFSAASIYMQQYGTNGAEELKNIWSSTLADPEAIAVLDAIWDEQQKSGKGVMSPDFSMEDVNGKTYTLSDFKGKVLYIDLWATWCMPCRQEIPYFKKLAEDFQGSNIVFVGMSVDKETDKLKWQNFVKDNGMTGVQLFAGDKNAFINAFQVNAIPRFLLIDKEGRIVDANMTRPSDKQTVNKLAMLAE